MLASLFVAVVGFVLVFVANRNQDPQGLINTDDVSGPSHYRFLVLYTSRVNLFLTKRFDHSGGRGGREGGREDDVSGPSDWAEICHLFWISFV